MEDFRYEGLTAEEWRELRNPSQPTAEDLGNMGIVQGGVSQEPTAPEAKPQKAEREDYEDLGYWQTVGDEVVAGAVEASKFFIPKKYELNYTPRTRAGEAFQTFSKYLLGIGGLFVGGEVAGVAKGIAAAKGATGAAKVAGGAEAILKGNKFFKTGKEGLKAVGVKALNIGTQGVLQGAILDATIHNADEGRIADMFGDTQNKFIDWLQTDENDSEAMGKLKNVIDGAIFSIGINGVVSAAEPILGRVLKRVKDLKSGAVAEESVEAVTNEIIQDQVKLSKIADTADIVNTVKELKETSEDASEAIINTFHPDNIEDAQNILKMLDAGEDIVVHEDGSYAIKISKWDDAHKVSPEEYKRQLAEADQAKADALGTANAGDTALEHQNEAVRHTWTNRGWIGENEELNQKTANKIIKNYKDKFKLDNNVKVEFVDGLTINGKAVEGNTSATTFLGKTAKNTQNAIDKKALQVQKLKDKVTMLEGGNEPVMEALDAAKEELRIAQNELSELKKTAQGKNLKPNITIQIDKNAKNPYAVLRDEIEHARDIAKGEVPNQSEKHFARYNGMNEGEMASDYVYKKSVGKNNALNPESPKQNVQPEAETPVKNVVTESEQLKLDFNANVSGAKSAEELVDNVASGTAKIADVEDVGTVLNKTIELDAEISGTTWEAIAKDADKMADVMLAAEELGLNKELAEALSMNDVKRMDEITRKVLAANRLSLKLTERLAILGENPPLEQMKPVVDLIDTISRYTKETGSASGRNLQARKFINKAVEVFGVLRLSPLTKTGINTVADILSVEINKIINLNFTKGVKLTPQQMKQQLMEDLLQNTESPFIQLLAEDKELAAKFDGILNDLFNGDGNVTPKNVYSKLEDAITEARYREVFNATKLAETPETKVKVIRNWCDAQGGVTSFYVHNLLSGVGTLAKNIISGGLNTAYFPAKKIIAGYLGGGEGMVREGWNTYRNLMSSWKEAWSLGKQAFLNGEGNLSMMRDTMALADGEVFNGFREWNFDFSTPEGIWHSIQNFHSAMTRAMGASDEFMSQLNYRAIKRAKALEQAENLAKQFNVTDEKVKALAADKIFKNAFDNAGKPLDADTLAEAKDILYQLPLNGQVFDRTTGEMKQVRPQSWVTQLAGGLNSGAAKNPLLKVMFPFVKTGANILQQNLEHNGIYAVLSNSQRQLLMSNTREGALARSQVAFGMFSFMTAAGLAMSGMITGSAPTDQKERAALFETGWKPYSIRIGDKFISYQGYEPIQTICGFAADSVNIYGNITNSNDEAKWEKFSQQVLATSVNNFLDKAAFRTGLRQLAFMTSPDENADDFVKALAQTGQGFLPDSAMIRNLSSVGDRSVTAPKSAYERIFNNYFNRGLGDYRRDVFGNRQDNIGLLVTNVAPDNASQPEYEEMEYLSQFGFSPSDISKTIKETTLKYTEFKDPETGRSVYDTMQEELSTIEIDGKSLQEAVRDLVTSQEYQDLPLGVNMNGYKYSSSEATKLNAIRSIFVEYNNAALQNVIRDYGELYIDGKGRTMSEAVEEVQNEKLNQSITEGLEHNIGNQVKRFGQ